MYHNACLAHEGHSINTDPLSSSNIPDLSSSNWYLAMCQEGHKATG